MGDGAEGPAAAGLAAEGLAAAGLAAAGLAARGLVASGLVAVRGERMVLSGVSLAVPPGGALLLTGPNGAGKSTLLRVLAGLIRADAGGRAWDGGPLDGAVGYLGHLDALKAALTPVETLRLWADADAARAALDAAGLSALAGLPVGALSAGQRRRLAIARLTLRAAPVWLLDEPTVGLDTAAIGRFAAQLAAHRGGGGVVVAATHVPLPLPGAGTLALG